MASRHRCTSPVETGRKVDSLRNLTSKAISFLPWLAVSFCLPGGALWAISQLGILLAESRIQQGSDVFWQLFPAAPLALALGVVGLLWTGALGQGWIPKLGVGATLLGLLMVISGILGQFWLALDDTFTVLAPAYYTFRGGLIILAVGAVILGISGFIRGALPAWGVVPFVLAALCGFVAFAWEIEALGAGLWSVFGAGWIWLGFSFVLSRVFSTVNAPNVSGSHSAKRSSSHPRNPPV